MTLQHLANTHTAGPAAGAARAQGWGCSRAPGVGTDAEEIEGSGEEKRDKACSGREEILPKPSCQFLCVCMEMWVGAKAVCEKAGAELGAREYLRVRLRGELEEPRVVLQGHEESLQSSGFLQRPQEWA